MAMKYHFRAENYALAYVVVPVNGFSSANFMNIAMCVAGNS